MTQISAVPNDSLLIMEGPSAAAVSYVHADTLTLADAKRWLLSTGRQTSAQGLTFTGPGGSVFGPPYWSELAKCTTLDAVKTFIGHTLGLAGPVSDEALRDLFSAVDDACNWADANPGKGNVIRLSEAVWTSILKDGEKYAGSTLGQTAIADIGRAPAANETPDASQARIPTPAQLLGGVSLRVAATKPPPQPHVAFVQVNNEGNGVTNEETGLRDAVSKQNNKPTFDRLNLTAGFNAGSPDDSAAAFESSMKAYFDDLIAKGQPLDAFILSGHSTAGGMLLQERTLPSGQHDYRDRFRPALVLLHLRNSDPRYARLLDGCQSVTLLACFQGGMSSSWQAVFPNATVGGTRAYAPAAASSDSAAIYRATRIAQGEYTQDGAPGVAAAAIAARASPAGLGLALTTPDRKAAFTAAGEECANAQDEYEKAKALIADIQGKGSTEGFTQAQLDSAYAAAARYSNALKNYYALLNSTGIDGAQSNKFIEWQAWVAADLFAIRKHEPRPVRPPPLTQI